MYKVVQIWPGQTVTSLHTIRPGHIWTTLYILTKFTCIRWPCPRCENVLMRKMLIKLHCMVRYHWSTPYEILSFAYCVANVTYLRHWHTCANAYIYIIIGVQLYIALINTNSYNVTFQCKTEAHKHMPWQNKISYQNMYNCCIIILLEKLCNQNMKWEK
jgi:hypothetical protein